MTSIFFTHKKKNWAIISVLLFFCAKGFTQETWSLERCVQQAQQNSLSLRQAKNRVRETKLIERQNTLSRYPNLNAGGSVGLNVGRAINPATNTFETNTSGFNSLSLNSGVLLYNGNRINHLIEQSKLNVAASESDAAQASNNLALNVAATYLQVLLSEEQLENTKKRNLQASNQLVLTEKLIAAGSRPQGDRLDLQAQIARGEQTLVSAQNLVDISYLNLKQLMILDPSQVMKVSKVDVTIPADAMPEKYQLDKIYIQALNNQPNIKAGELREKSAEIDVLLAKATGLPTVSMGANVSSFYSTRGLKYSTEVVGTKNIDQNVIFNGTPSVVTFVQPDVRVKTAKDPYINQLSENLGAGVNVSINVPLYNNGQTSIGKERAQLNILNTQIANEQSKQLLKSDIQKAIADARAAKKTLDAAEKTFKASQNAYENAEKRFKVGAINTFELTNSKNNLDTSETDLTVAKYDYLFKLKILDFYQGKKM